MRGLLLIVPSVLSGVWFSSVEPGIRAVTRTRLWESGPDRGPFPLR